ncbi:hypothetical protein Y032_0804g2430, partial [Ancylostoma ceylanicum]
VETVSKPAASCIHFGFFLLVRMLQASNTEDSPRSSAKGVRYDMQERRGNRRPPPCCKWCL